MNRYDNLEMRIMSCVLVKPELMKQVFVQDKYFVKYKRLWKFLKAFYNKFETFDCTLMYSVCKDKYQILKYIEFLLEYDCSSKNFDKYQKQLIEQYEQNERDKIIIDKIYEWANELYVKNMPLDKFIELVNQTQQQNI